MRKPSIKTVMIRGLLDAGRTNGDIVRLVPGCNSTMVSKLRYKQKQKQKELGKISDSSNEVQIGGKHYLNKRIQPWDAIHSWNLGFFSGNVVKYVARHKEKGGVEDLKKARHYLDKLISVMSGK